MPLSKIASLAVGLLGLFVIVDALPIIQSLLFALIPESFTGVKATNDASYKLILLAMVLSTIFLGLILIISRNVIGSFLIGETSSDTLRISETDHYHSIAFSVVGIYFVIHGASNFLGTTLPRSMSKASISIAWPAGIELLLGAFLFVGARPLALIWNRLRAEWQNKK